MTELGKVIRNIRLARGEILLDMAKKMGYSASFLSAIETGKNLPSDFKEKLCNVYSLTDAEINKLDLAFGAAQKSLNTNIYEEAIREDYEAFNMFPDAFQRLIKRARRTEPQ